MGAKCPRERGMEASESCEWLSRNALQAVPVPAGCRAKKVARACSLKSTLAKGTSPSFEMLQHVQENRYMAVMLPPRMILRPRHQAPPKARPKLAKKGRAGLWLRRGAGSTAALQAVLVESSEPHLWWGVLRKCLLPRLLEKWRGRISKRASN